MGKKAKPVRRGPAKKSATAARTAVKTAKRSEARPAPPVSAATKRVQFTHVDKVMFPEAGVTKGDVLDFYLKIADNLLPHLRDRPVTLERLPDGVGEGKPRFWQKNTPPYYPEWIPRIDLPTDEGKPVLYALVNDVETLAYLVNQGAITFHPFLSRIQDLDRPDFVLFDLDPGTAKFVDVVKIANTLHTVLDAASVPSFVKTSGKSGLHVLVPWRRRGGYDEARAWATEVAKRVIVRLPDLATVERFKSARQGRVYVDVIQNNRGKHAVPPYVLRATPQATVSTPLEWKEVTPKLDPRRFDMKTVLTRVIDRPDPLALLAGS